MFGRKPKHVYVLGAGPSGLLAAHAAMRCGYTAYVFTHPGADGAPRKSELHGCQYLHQDIAGLNETEEPTKVSYELTGDSESYRRKVYGSNWAGSLSPDEYGPERNHLAWDLRAAYDKLWERMLPHIVPTVLGPENIKPFTSDPRGVTLATIPAPALCRRPEEHKFVTQQIWAMGSRYGFDARMPYKAPADTVQCNAEDAPRWYRAATVFGHSTIEWPEGARPPVSGVVPVSKPLSTDCDCHLRPGRYERIGRYGQWRKGVLVHHAFDDVMRILS